MAAPAQQREEDKALRGNIRGLMHRAKHEKHNLVSLDHNKLVELVQESNQYVGQVTRPRDQAVDAELFNILTEAGVEYVASVNQGGRTYTAGDFVRRLKAHHVSDTDAQHMGAADPEAFNWAGLGQLFSVAALFRPAPVVHHMLGPMDAQPRQRRQVQRQARRRAPVGEAVRPEEVEDLDDQDKQETDRNMEEMWHVLRDKGGRVVVLDLVLNHLSFAQTVENMFTLSFLVRDNKVSLEDDEEQGLIVVQRTNAKQNPKDKGSGDNEKMQFLIAIDIETWELWKQATDASVPPMMKHRREWRQHQTQQQQQQAAQQQQQPQQHEEAEVPQEQQQQAPQRQLPRPQQEAKRQRRQPPQESQPEAHRSTPRRQRQVKQEPQQVQQQQQEEYVVTISSDSDVVVIQDSEEDDNHASLPRKQQRQVKPEPGTQATQGTQGTQGRVPTRGKRASGRGL